MLRTLLVDDNRLFLDALKKLLAAMTGIEVVGTAASGEQALHEIERLAPDLVLLDLMMPGMRGFSALRAIRGLGHAPQVVVVTLHDTSDYRDEAQNSGAIALIAKHALDEELPPLIARLLDPAQMDRRVPPTQAA